MTLLHIEDLFFPGIVSLLGAAQLARFARRVGEARGRYKIPVPKTDGDPNFERIFRAQQNTIEFYPIFITLLWMSSIFLHHAIPSIFGLIYLYARHKYFYGYSLAAEERLPGFRLAIKIIMILLILSIAGIASTGYTKYTGRKVDVSFYQKKALEIAKPAVDKLTTIYKWIQKASAPYMTIVNSHVDKAVKKITDVGKDLGKNLEAFAKIAYSNVCLFADRAAGMISRVCTLLSQYLGTLRKNISSTFLQTSDRKEL